MATSSQPEWDRILSASQKNNAIAIATLVEENGVSPNHTNAVGQSSLHVAALWGNIDAVRALLSFDGIKLDTQNRVTGATPIHSAIQSIKEPAANRVECVKLLLDAGANPHLQDLYGMTPLDLLDSQVDGDNAQDLDKEYLTSMRECLEAGSVQDTVLIPLVEAVDLEGMVNQLQGNDVQIEVDERDKRTGMTPLSLSIQKIDDVLGADVDKGDREQNDLTIRRLSKIIELLLENGADPNVVPDKVSQESILRETSTPFYHTCKVLSDQYKYSVPTGNDSDDSTKTIQNCLEGIVCNLVQHGAEQSPYTIRFMHDAARRGTINAMRFWIEKIGLDPNTKGRQGLTALHFAARSGRVEIVQYLLDVHSSSGENLRAIDVSIKDDRGKTALDAAIVNNKQDIVDILQRKKKGNKDDTK